MNLDSSLASPDQLLRLAKTRELELTRELVRRKARIDFGTFVKWVMPEYYFNWHHRVLIDHLERLLYGDIRRLMVSMPPRHGKSTLASQMFPAWALGRNPTLQVIGCSYNATLAEHIADEIKRVMTSAPYKATFTRTRIRESRAVDKRDPQAKNKSLEFDVLGNGRGKYSGAGVNGAITGKGAHLLIIDDPVKNHIEAESQTFRDRTYRWYSSDAYSRLEKDGRVLLIMTRWHEDDLAGRLLANAKEDPTSEQWHVVNFPAIATGTTPMDPRKLDEALWPEKYSRAALEVMRKQLGSRYWSSLYQQTPADQEGNIFKRDWFGRYSHLPHTPVNYYVDSAYTADQRNDSTAIIAYQLHGGQLYVRNCISVRMEFPKLVAFLPQWVKQNGYSQASRIRIEPKASGLSIYQHLREHTTLNWVKDKAPKDPKVTRAHAVAALVEAGRVLLPEYGQWVGEFLQEVCAFPTAKHDDKVDCLTAALRISFKRPAIRMTGRKISTQ